MRNVERGGCIPGDGLLGAVRSNLDLLFEQVLDGGLIENALRRLGGG
jgi:hypothetical protein